MRQLQVDNIILNKGSLLTCEWQFQIYNWEDEEWQSYQYREGGRESKEQPSLKSSLQLRQGHKTRGFY